MPRLRSVLPPPPPPGTGLLVGATGLLAVGKGLLLTTLVVYLVGPGGLSPVRAALGASAWGLAAVLASLPSGALVDRLGARRVGVTASLVALPAVAAVGSVRGLVPLLAVLFVAGFFDAAGGVGRRALLASRPGAGVAALAWARTSSNVGFAAAAVISVPLLASDSAAAYQVAYLAAALTYPVVASAIAVTAPRPRPEPPTAPSPDGLAVTRRADLDRMRTTGRSDPEATARLPVAAALAGSTAILSVHNTLLNVALPLWILQHTSVPISALGWLVLVNTVLVIVAQVPLSAGASTVPGALRATRSAALWTAGACALLALSGAGAIAWQSVLLVLAVVALSIGELLQSAGEWGLSALLAGDGEHGLYQSACVFGESVQQAAGPLLVGGLLAVTPFGSWAVLVALLLGGRGIAQRIGRLAQEPSRRPPRAVSS